MLGRNTRMSKVGLTLIQQISKSKLLM